jgi:PAS domain S-box-containing protein
MAFSIVTDQDSKLFAAAGEAAALLRAHDWQASPLGWPEVWPQPLRTLTAVMLDANQPMFIAWGAEHTLLYNDSYAEILAAKHPAAMGRPFLDVWSEIRDDLVPIVRQAYAGEPVHMDDITLVMQRRGYSEETHFSFSYTPIRDEGGAVRGLFCACTETTEKVLAQRRRVAEAERLRRMFELAPGAISILRGPEHVVEFVNLAHRRMFGSENWIGKPMRDAFPDLAGQGYLELLDRVFATGERHVGTSVPIVYRRSPDAPKVERLLDFFYEPMLDEAGQVTGIFTERLDVTEARRAEIALRAHAARQDFRLALEERLRDLQDPDALVAAAAEALGRHLRADQVFYVKVDAAGEHGVIEGGWRDGAMRGEGELPRLEAFGAALAADLKRGQTVAIGSVRSDSRTNAPGFLSSVAAGAFIAVPLLKSGRLVAILGICDRSPRDWTPEEISLAEEVAERTWALVERARAELERDRFFALSLDMLAIASAADRTWKRVNPAFRATLGWTESDLVDKPFLDIVHPDDRARSLAAVTALAEGRSSEELELRACCRDGSYRWIAWTTVPYAAEGLLYCVGRDVTERRQSEMRFRRMADNLPLNVWLHDRHGRLDFVNQTFCDYFGVTADEVRGDKWHALMRPDGDLAAYVDDFRACVRDRQPFHAEFRARRADGTWRWLESWGQPTFDHTGRYLGHVGTSLDVTERKAAKESLVASERRLRRVLDQLFAFVGVLTPEGILQQANRAPLEGAGIALEEVIGQPFDQTYWWSYDAGVQARLREAMRRAAEGEAVRYEVPVRMAGGRLLTIDFQIAPLRDDEGRIVGLIPSAIDIDERKRGERQRELLINELNHRVKNTLAVVQGLAFQTFRNANDPAASLTVFQARLAALAAAHNLLTAASWENTSLEAMARQIVTATCGQGRHVTLSGPPIELAPKRALTLALALHELCTNAVKYGALSGRSGHVGIEWSVSGRCEPMLRLVWREHGGPPVAPPRRKGFGLRMIERVLAEEFDGEVTLSFDREGLVCTMTGSLPEAAAPA